MNFPLLIEKLRAVAAQVHMLEQEADAALERDEEALFREKMQNKAELLTALEDLEPLAEGSDEIAEFARQKLERFAHNANMSLELESVFYMSALLYPETYADGQPNDLDIFIEQLAEKTAQK